jgi:hypothetical protein
MSLLHSPWSARRAGSRLYELGRRISARFATFGILEAHLYRPLPEGEHQEHHDIEDWDECGEHIPTGISGLCNDLYLTDEAEDEHQDEEQAEDAKEH